MTSPAYITVEAPARLHMGFMDLNGSLGRRFGSLGLALEEICVRLNAGAASDMACEGPQSARAETYLRQLHTQINLPGGVHVQIEQAIPEHAGLGSGTQLAIALGVAVTRLYGLDFTPRELASMLDRGNRSGIGVGAFEQGGFLVDGGRGAGDSLPPLISRLDFPAHWRVLLIMHHDLQGLHGGAEKNVFRDLPPFSNQTAAHLSRLVVMNALPALAEARLQEFGRAISELQNCVGDYFAPVQGGRYTSPLVTQALQWLSHQGVAGIGQSSWGPTGFAIVESEAQAQTLLDGLRTFAQSPSLEFKLCSARNRGGEVNSASRNIFAFKSAS
ncbi:MAG: beta-ribofuranosylaminobenzene 5'-phosphate synthase family protein [Burkholderiales bacterium]